MERKTTDIDEEVPVLIVGGGGAGLAASMLLARQGVGHLLVSARPQTSDLPKAHVLNQRAMEVLDDVGVADAIAERSTPAGQMAATAYYAGFAGPGPEYGRRLARLESWGGRRGRRQLAGGESVAPAEPAPDPPRAAAEDPRRGTLARADPLDQLIGLEQDDRDVRATIRDNASGRRYVVRCQYLLGADGGRRVAGW